MDVDRTPDSATVTDALNQLIDVLTTHQIRYALIGGVAAGLRSQFRYTKDVDLLLVVPQIHLSPLLDTLSERGFEFDTVETIAAWNRYGMVAMSYRKVRVDWLKPVLPLYQHVLDAARTEDWHGRPLQVATAEGLIVLKLIASRPQDIADIGSLLAANRGRLDLAWVEAEWLTVFPLDDPRWLRFRQAVGEYYETA